MNTYVSFQVAEEGYALDLKYIQEVIHAVAITRVPHSTSFIRGVINVRGKVIPVLDLKSFFYKQASSYGKDSHLIIARSEENCAALVVDQIQDVLSLRPEDLEEPQKAIPISDFLESVGNKDDSLLLVLNFPKILQSARLSYWEEKASLVSEESENE